MDADKGSRQPTRHQIDVRHLPDILEVEARHVHYSKPRPYVDGPRLIEMREGIEITIRTSGEFPIRALSPVLFVGGVALTEGEQVGENLYRFYFPYIERLKEGEAISLDWTREPQQRVQTAFVYTIHREEAQ